jgi:ubiquinone/menaquinone biosynthesis C-methylase UbiE
LLSNDLYFSNPFEDPSVVEGYEGWYNSAGQRADRLEKALLERLLGEFPQAQSVLEVGCGTGHFTRWLASLELEVIGLDLSAVMLREAVRIRDHPYVRGDALALPFGTNSFDFVAMITTLEFTADPLLTLIEGLRVARSGLILGVLNRKSRLGQRLRNQGGAVWNQARFFSPRELMRQVRLAAYVRRLRLKVRWLTTLWPLLPGALPLPWGGFIGMAVRLL